MIPPPQKPRLSPLLTDLYELTMAYSYYNHGRHREAAVFDVFFRSAPFNGTFTIFAGLSDVLHFIQNFEFTQEEVDYLCKENNLNIAQNSGFRKYLLKGIKKDLKKLKIYAIPEGSVVFPRIPVIRLEGPLGLCQILETPILNLTGYASLVTTNAARMKLAAGDRVLLEFGLRRAQGPDGGISAAKYAVMGGFLGTSNCLAGYMNDLPISGTLAHAYINSQNAKTEIVQQMLKKFTKDHDTEEKKEMNFVDFIGKLKKALIEIGGNRFQNTNENELKAFVSYAITFPKKFLALVDTYNTLKSGVPNFLIVSLGLMFFGYKPVGIRLDSGDLSKLAKESRKLFVEFKELLVELFEEFEGFKEEVPVSSVKEFIDNCKENIDKFLIVASNDLDEAAIKTLVGNDKSSKNRSKKFPENQKCEIDSFGIGTHLVTCKAQPALGMVYKLSLIDGEPCIKLSEEPGKQTFPGAKEGFRIFDKNGFAVCDILAMKDEDFKNKQFELEKKINMFEEVIVEVYDIQGNTCELSGMYCDQLHQPVDVSKDQKKISELQAFVKNNLLTPRTLEEMSDSEKSKTAEPQRKFREEVLSGEVKYPVYVSRDLFLLTQKLKEENMTKE